jgi:hypothetical protein
MNSETLFRAIGEWGDRTFPASTDHSKLIHLAKEFDELREDPGSGEEMADMVMLIAHIAYSHGIDLLAEIERKFQIVQARQWGEPDADGVVEHIRELREVPNETDFTRAGGDCVCDTCGKTYYKHHQVIVANTNRLILTELCDGRFVKL